MREKPLSARYPREKLQKSDTAGRAYSVSIPISDCTVKGSGREFNLVLGRGAKSRLKKYTLQVRFDALGHPARQRDFGSRNVAPFDLAPISRVGCLKKKRAQNHC
jgi:hypothetical protein